MQSLYPPIKINQEYRLAVTHPHVLYVEESGDPNGLPVLVIHSGPGTGCEPYHRRFFDPSSYRIICFDQRGAGRSTPHVELASNTTAHLLSDMEAIREHLKIDRWVLWGTAWGTALSLLYAQTYPERVIGIIGNSVFLARAEDIAWFYKDGANQVFPDYWQDFIQILPEHMRSNPLAGYHQQLTGTDEILRMSSAKSWSLWQARCATLQPHNHVLEHFTDPRVATGLAVIESHYLISQCFIEENQILNHVATLRQIPGILIHGRYNLLTPLRNAWSLHQAWPGSDLMVIRDAGHSIQEPGMIDANILATQRMARIFQQAG